MAAEVLKKAKNEYFSDCKFICNHYMEQVMAKKILKAMKIDGHRVTSKMNQTEKLEVMVRILFVLLLFMHYLPNVHH